MKIRLINKDAQQHPFDVTDEFVKEVAAACISILKKRLKRIIPDVTIIFVSKKAIQRYNKRYRGYDKPTDVLSFPSEEDGYLGDILISKEEVYEYSNKYGCSYEDEISRDIIHGIMHLLGYDHSQHLTRDSREEMFLIQEDILKQLSK